MGHQQKVIMSLLTLFASSTTSATTLTEAELASAPSQEGPAVAALSPPPTLETSEPAEERIVREKRVSILANEALQQARNSKAAHTLGEGEAAYGPAAEVQTEPGSTRASSGPPGVRASSLQELPKFSEKHAHDYFLLGSRGETKLTGKGRRPRKPKVVPPPQDLPHAEALVAPRPVKSELVELTAPAPAREERERKAESSKQRAEVLPLPTAAAAPPPKLESTPAKRGPHSPTPPNAPAVRKPSERGTPESLAKGAVASPARVAPLRQATPRNIPPPTPPTEAPGPAAAEPKVLLAPPVLPAAKPEPAVTPKPAPPRVELAPAALPALPKERPAVRETLPSAPNESPAEASRPLAALPSGAPRPAPLPTTLTRETQAPRLKQEPTTLAALPTERPAGRGTLRSGPPEGRAEAARSLGSSPDLRPSPAPARATLTNVIQEPRAAKEKLPLASSSAVPPAAKLAIGAAASAQALRPSSALGAVQAEVARATTPSHLPLAKELALPQAHLRRAQPAPSSLQPHSGSTATATASSTVNLNLPHAMASLPSQPTRHFLQLAEEKAELSLQAPWPFVQLTSQPRRTTCRWVIVRQAPYHKFLTLEIHCKPVLSWFHKLLRTSNQEGQLQVLQPPLRPQARLRARLVRS